jgi:hypothetical protein
MRATLVQLVIAVLGVIYCAVPALAQNTSGTYTIFEPPNAVGTLVQSISPLGAVIGGYFSPCGGPDCKSHGFVRTVFGTFASFDPTGSLNTFPMSINAAGIITGNYQKQDQAEPHGFVRDLLGNITTFDGPGVNGNTCDAFCGTRPTSINAAGTIAGTYTVICNGVVAHGFIRDRNGNITSFDPPTGQIFYSRELSGAFVDINVAGTVSGTYYDGKYHGFVRSPFGAFTPLDVPGSNGTFASAINDLGAITGWYTDPKGVTHGFVRNIAGTFLSFDAGVNTFPADINIFGAVAGSYVDAQNKSHAFVRQPNGNIVTLFIEGCDSMAAAGIDGFGTVTGSFNATGGESHGFIYKP